MDGHELVALKAELLCLGLQPSDVTQRVGAQQNPCADRKTGNCGLHLRLPSGSHVLVSVSHDFDRRSPFSLKLDPDGHLSLVRGNRAILSVEASSAPSWYVLRTSTGKPMPSILLHEGRGFLHQAYSGCDFMRGGMGCRFCSVSSHWHIGAPDEVAETALAALHESRIGYEVCLGGGTRLPLHENSRYFAECCSAIRDQHSDVPIWVEMTAPETDREIDEMVQAGATSFGFNLELWDEPARREICPGKSAVPKARVVAALEYARQKLGVNRTGSCLIVGAEPAASTIIGVHELARRGVQPCLIPFRPWNGAAMSDRSPCDPDQFLQASYEAVAAMRANGLSPEANQGCRHCDGCGVDHDIYKVERQVRL